MQDQSSRNVFNPGIKRPPIALIPDHPWVRMTKVSKSSTLASFLWEEVHQAARSKQRPSGVSACHRSLCSTRCHICLAKEQLSNKCEMVSVWEQSMQVSTSCKLWRFLLSAVQQQSWRINQIKNLHLLGAWFFSRPFLSKTSTVNPSTNNGGSFL